MRAKGMVMAGSTQCLECRNFRGLQKCTAFRDKDIPVEIFIEGFDHRKPFEGDHGIRWEANPDFLKMRKELDLGPL